ISVFLSNGVNSVAYFFVYRLHQLSLFCLQVCLCILLKLFNICLQLLKFTLSIIANSVWHSSSLECLIIVIQFLLKLLIFRINLVFQLGLQRLQIGIDLFRIWHLAKDIIYICITNLLCSGLTMGEKAYHSKHSE